MIIKLEQFNINYIHLDLYNIDRFHIIKELGYPNIGPLIKNKENNSFFNQPTIHWFILDKNENCIAILFLNLYPIQNKGNTEVNGVIETIINNEDINLKKRFIDHFVLDKIDEELNDYLEEWNDFHHHWSLGIHSNEVITYLEKYLKCEIR